MKFIVTLIIICSQLSVWAFDHKHEKWTKVLSQYQNKMGLINYSKLKKDIQISKDHTFSIYIRDIQAVRLLEFEKWDSKQKMAFLINAYNALTVKLILDHYPVKSIKKIGSFFSNPWKLEFFKLLDGKISSLDPIEHVWLRPKYKDYRIHAAVNCASISCPQLRNEAFIAERLEEQLNEQMGLWLQDKNRNEIEIKDKTFRASKIFDWYKDDFQSWGGGIWNVLKKHLKSSKLPQDIDSFEIDYLEYNWDLNEFRN